MCGINLNSFKKIQSGNDAEIYEFNTEKVLKLYFNSIPCENIKREFNIMSALKDSSINVPTVFEMVKIDNREGFLMEKINGESLFSISLKKPWMNLKLPIIMAQIQYDINSLVNIDCTYSLKDFLLKKIDERSNLPNSLLEFVHKVADDLPDSSDICHGDMHLGNIMVKENQYYVIDWYDAGYGDYLADVARTLSMLNYHPYIGFQSLGKNKEGILNKFEILRFKIFIELYFKKYQSLKVVDFERLKKWQVLTDAELMSGNDNYLKERYYEYIKKCYDNYKIN